MLSGCGSAASPPLTVRCTIQRLSAGFLRARVTVTNTTNRPQRAFLYGQPMPLIVREYPVYGAEGVALTVHNATYQFVGLVIPRIAAHKSRWMLLRFQAPVHPRSLVVSNQRVIHAPDWHVLDNPDCVIPPRR